MFLLARPLWTGRCVSRKSDIGSSKLQQFILCVLSSYNIEFLAVAPVRSDVVLQISSRNCIETLTHGICGTYKVLSVV